MLGWFSCNGRIWRLEMRLAMVAGMGWSAGVTIGWCKRRLRGSDGVNVRLLVMAMVAGIGCDTEVTLGKCDPRLVGSDGVNVRLLVMAMVAGVGGDTEVTLGKCDPLSVDRFPVWRGEW